MKQSDILRAWGRILSGRRPVLSIELTRECPLRCPGCYAYEDQHLNSPDLTLRQLSDYKGSDLVRRVLQLVDEHRPLHLSLVGGDPLVRYRELQALLPELSRRAIHVQLVTSAFRPIPQEWSSLPHLTIVVSVDGLQAEHDARRKPATYQRILNNIQGGHFTVHCTITSQMMKRPGYLELFTRFWSERNEIQRIWFSIFTPQQGATDPEILTAQQRLSVVRELSRLRQLYPRIAMGHELIEELAHPPKSPDDCIFARTTTSLSADLKTRITPCQFGGTPDCSQCGCLATMALAAVGRHRVLPGLNVRHIFAVSEFIGQGITQLRAAGRLGQANPAAEPGEEQRAA